MKLNKTRLPTSAVFELLSQIHVLGSLYSLVGAGRLCLYRSGFNRLPTYVRVNRQELNFRALTQMSNAGIPLRVIQEISGHRNLEQLQRYLEVGPDQVRGAIASLSMLSYAGKLPLPHVQDESTAAPSVPLPPSQLSHTLENESSPEEILE